MVVAGAAVPRERVPVGGAVVVAGAAALSEAVSVGGGEGSVNSKASCSRSWASWGRRLRVTSASVKKDSTWKTWLAAAVSAAVTLPAVVAAAASAASASRS